jgi:hypothetical protein
MEKKEAMHTPVYFPTMHAESIAIERLSRYNRKFRVYYIRADTVSPSYIIISV